MLDNRDSPSSAAISVTSATAQGPTDGDGEPNGDPNNKGFEIYSRGAVTLKSINAYDFASDGVYIENSGTGAVTITGSTDLWNETARNGGNGYTIISKGPVTVSNLNSFDNNNLGGYIKNSDASGAAPVTVINNAPVGYLNIYERNGGGGLQILSRGAVTVRSCRRTITEEPV